MSTFQIKHKALLTAGLIKLMLLITCLSPGHAATSPEPAKNEFSLETAIETVATGLGPTVVSIRTEVIESYRPRYRFQNDPYADEFFQRFFQDFFGELPEQQRRRSGMGSGVIIDKDGYILTNEHVVNNASKITVTLSDGREFKAVLKGTDPRSDLAVIKIDAPNLPVASLGDSDQLRTGQWVVAIGNPFGYLLANSEPTVTTGVISALHRSLPRTSRADTDYSDLIQTDAAINPGNSGGPLTNLKGQVIGINVAIFSTSGGYQGIGFAIPINYAKRIVAQLIKGEEISYGWIGVSIQEVDDRLAQYFGLKKREGVLVVKVLENSPAQKADVRDGDIITSINGQKIKNVSSLIHKIGNSPIGEPITLDIFRDGKMKKIPVVISKRPGTSQLSQQNQEKNGESASKPVPAEPMEWRGIHAREITPSIAQQLHLSDVHGVIITNIEAGSPADDAGLHKGDIIISINKMTVKNIQDFSQITAEAKGNCLVRTFRGYYIVNE